MESPSDSQEIGNKPTAQSSVAKCSLSISTEGLQKTSSMWLDSPSAMGRQYDSPVALYCHGFCRDFGPAERNPDLPDIVSRRRGSWICTYCLWPQICISSSKDSQRSWEDSNGNSMSQILVKILSKSRLCLAWFYRALTDTPSQHPKPDVPGSYDHRQVIAPCLSFMTGFSRFPKS